MMQYDYTRVSKPCKILNNDGNMGKPLGITLGKNGLWAVADISKHCVYNNLMGRIN